ncbi:SWA2 [Symbiodinium necroappetens]|uniref:SWA2 protein n=1 Tax=Symbiodinium necroappetens TaxID=1628268 RepID=A0A812PIH5_9DINO|nr:SWA2 [Symbiodinium necroappetens]
MSCVILEVTLLSGRAVQVTATASWTMEELKLQAQKALQTGRGMLLNASGDILHGALTVDQASLRTGDVLTFHLRETSMAATASAFAAVLGDGSLVSWGNPNSGGDSSSVQHRLLNVRQVSATHGAFAALLGDGSVVTWGRSETGGDSSSVQDRLHKVSQIKATGFAFAAMLHDGSVVTWGDSDYGGDSSGVRDDLHHVQEIEATDRAFAAVLTDGSVRTWGSGYDGGDCKAVQGKLRDVREIHAARGGAFAAVLGDGSVVAWGSSRHGGDNSSVRDQLRDVKKLRSSHGAFAAILADGSVLTWGRADDGGDSSAIKEKLRNVQDIRATDSAFAAILADGSVATWGSRLYGGLCQTVQRPLQKVLQIDATDRAFLANLADGSLVTWGESLESKRPTDSSPKRFTSTNLVEAVSLPSSAWILVDGPIDGSLVTWDLASIKEHGGHQPTQVSALASNNPGIVDGVSCRSQLALEQAPMKRRRANLMRNAKGERVLTGLLNFPPFYQVPSAFCGYILESEFANYSTQGSWKSKADMTGLAQVMKAQLDSDRYESLDLLGNFVDNHDEYGRIAHYCQSDTGRIKNALTWLMLAQGIPIVYYGTEQGLSGHQWHGPGNPGDSVKNDRKHLGPRLP